MGIPNKSKEVDWAKELASAIVERAALDYEEALMNLKKYADPASAKTIKPTKRKYVGRYWSPEEIRERIIISSNKTIVDCEKFFRSEWYTMLCHLDGEYVMRTIRKRVDGKACDICAGGVTFV